eukprot:scaffold140596_cov50-Attheya_sp.AAC.1
MAATSEEEIGKQHAAAQEQIEWNAASMEMVDRGEIPLSWKQQPTELEPELWDDCPVTSSNASNGDNNSNSNNNTSSSRFCISSRGMVDVGPLADLVRVGHNDDIRKYARSKTDTSDHYEVPDERNLWDERNAAVHN